MLVNDNKLLCLAGLPRSGTTWLSSVLKQNPNLYIPLQSPFVEILWRNFSIWEEPEWEADTSTEELQKIQIPYLQKLTQVYFNELTDKSLVIDARRSWHSLFNITMYIKIFGERPKIICPVRNVQEIIASYKKIFIKNKWAWDSDMHMAGNLFDYPYQTLKRTYNSEYRDCLFIIDYHDLVDNAEDTLDRIYDFLDIPRYKHDFKTGASVKEQTAYKNIDKQYKLVGLHKIKRGVVKSKTNPSKILTKEEFSKYQDYTFWDYG